MASKPRVTGLGAGKRVAAWLIYGCLVAGAFVGVWYVVQDNNSSGEDTVVDTYGPVLVFSFINGALPYPIKKLPGLLEHYKHPRTEMQVKQSVLTQSSCLDRASLDHHLPYLHAANLDHLRTALWFLLKV